MYQKVRKSIAVIGLLLVMVSFHNSSSTKQEKGMIKVTILYPNGDGKKFDMDYYKSTHMPLVAKLLGDSLKLITIDKGLSAGTPGTPAAYLAIGALYFEKLSAYQNSIGPHINEIRADIPKFTNSVPVIQISEVIQ